jgi:adenylate kinase
MRITFFGPPGSGKGTQAERISEYYGLEHISTGMLLREEIRSGSKLGVLIRKIVESGHLVSDDIVNREVIDRIERMEDYLLDGYPRNLSQAKRLDRFLEETGKPLSGAVFIQVPEEEVLKRLTGRLVCACADGTGHSAESREGDICRECGKPFVRRSDDSIEVVRNRLHHYHNLTMHLEEYYRGRLLSIDGVGTIEQVFQRIMEALRPWA